MTRIEHTLTIDRPVDEVWDHLMDARNDPVPTLETDAHGFFRLAEPVFARMAKRDFAGNFETLKDLLESRNDSRTDGP